MSFKKDFLEYVLYTYEFYENDPVYVLNFLKTIDHFDSRVTFLKKDAPITLTISTKGSISYSMMCRIEDKVLLKAKDILNEIDKTEKEIFLEFHFDHFETKYTEVVFREHERLIFQEEAIRHSLYMRIEHALETNDKDTFLILTNELKQLDEESKNALHKK